MAAKEKVDPATGERWRMVNPVYKRNWFNWLIVFTCCLVAGALWWLANPERLLSQEGLHYVQLGQSLLNGHGYSVPNAAGTGYVAEANTMPLYPVLVVIIMFFTGGAQHPEASLPVLHYANLVLYLMSIVSVYYLSNHYLRQPLPLLTTAFYTLTPLTLTAAMDIGPLPLFMVLSLRALRTIDKAFGKAGQGKLPSDQQLKEAAIFIILACLAHPAAIALALVFLWLNLRWLGLNRGLVWGLGVAVFLIPALVYRIYLGYWPTLSNLKSHQMVSASPLVSSSALRFAPLMKNTEQSITLLSKSVLGDNPLHKSYLPLVEPGLQRPASVSSWTQWPDRFLLPFARDILAWGIGAFIIIGLLNLAFQGSGALGFYGLFGIISNVLIWDLVDSPLILGLYPVGLLALVAGLQLLLGKASKPLIPGFKFAVIGLAAFILFTGGWDYVTHYQDRRLASLPKIQIPALPGFPSKAREGFYQISPGQAVQQDTSSLIIATNSNPELRTVSVNKEKSPSALQQQTSLLASVPADKTGLKSPPESLSNKIGVFFAQPLGLVKSPNAKETLVSPAKKPLALNNTSAPVPESSFISRLQNTVNKASTALSKPMLAEAPTPAKAPEPPQARYKAVCSWVSASTAPMAKLVSAESNAVAQACGRATIPYPPLSPPEVMIQSLNRVNYVLIDKENASSTAAINQLLATYPNRFKKVHEAPNGVQVIRVLPKDDLALKLSAPQLKPRQVSTVPEPG